MQGLERLYGCSGHRIGTPEVLFRIIDDLEVTSLRARFAGSQAEQRKRAGHAPGAGASQNGNASVKQKHATALASSSSSAAKHSQEHQQVCASTHVVSTNCAAVCAVRDACC